MKIRSLRLAAFVAIFGLASVNVIAQSDVKSVASVNQNKSALAGKTITAQGKVVKVNNGIMGRNFVHVQDGTGQAGSDKLIITSKQTANVGDQVSISGVVVLDRDFGSGYTYPLLIEDASITPKK
jgi:hypothetical protein